MKRRCLLSDIPDISRQCSHSLLRPRAANPSFTAGSLQDERWPSSRLEEQTEFSLVTVYVTVTLSMNCASSALCLSYKRAPKVAGSVSTNCGSFWLTSRTADPKQHLLKQPPASAKSPRNLESRRQGNDLNVPRGSDKACI